MTPFVLSCLEIANNLPTSLKSPNNLLFDRKKYIIFSKAFQTVLAHD